MTNNFERMIQLAEEFFATKNDPSQLTITEEVMEQLRSIHPATMGEVANEQGPIAWTIVIPTTRRIQEQFLNGEIGESELLELTLRTRERYLKYTSIYLCSALTLPEFRAKGLAKKLVCDSIREIQKEHPIDGLFVWAFSEEGKKLARNVSVLTTLPLFEYKEK
ncbi:MAG: hypothetical protein WCW40_03495 [Bacteroidota bacterium]